jgi:hypothetical protein
MIFINYGVKNQGIGEPFNPILFTTTATDYIENTSFVQGYVLAGGTITENNFDGTRKNVLITASPIQARSEITWVTDKAINLTPYSLLKIRWRNTGSTTSTNVSRLCVSTNKTGDSTTFDARINKTNTFNEIEESLNISALNGNYFIRVHSRDDAINASITCNVFVYEIKLE